MTKKRTAEDLEKEIQADRNECTNQEDRLYAFLASDKSLSTEERMKSVNEQVPPNPQWRKEKE